MPTKHILNLAEIRNFTRMSSDKLEQKVIRINGSDSSLNKDHINLGGRLRNIHFEIFDFVIIQGISIIRTFLYKIFVKR